jgi:hypothetical protein
MWLAAVQAPAFVARALPWRPLGPPVEPAGELPSLEGSSHGYEDPSLVA